MAKTAKTEPAEGDAAPKKGGRKKLILIVVGALLVGGGGAVGGMFAAGFGGGDAHAAETIDHDAPTLVVREHEDAHEADAHKPVGSFAPDPKVYKPSYYVMEQNFTSNLRDTDGIVQMALGVSTFYDGKVTDAVKDNEMPIRSAALDVLASQDAFVLETPEGKAKLRVSLKDAINKVLVEKTGYGGIDNVYFTSFIIQ